MTLQQLHYAITIAETGSFNKAAEILYVAQPSLSGAIQDLERELGIIIFSRSGRGTSLTNEGLEFIIYARQIYQQYETLLSRYGKDGRRKKKFGVSTQHYSFAIKSFVELVKRFDTEEYEFFIRETKTRAVIDDVATSKSEIGILYLSDFNRKVLEKILRANNLRFQPLIECEAYVYLWRRHPLARNRVITLAELADYPCLAFEQGTESSFYYAEEILSTNEYPRMIRATDRATMLNLMVGLNGFTLCSGIICEELNGSDFVAVPFAATEDMPGSRMTIGYIVSKNMILSNLAEMYIEEITNYLQACQS